VNRQPRALVYAACLAFALAGTACTAAGGPVRPASGAGSVAGTITGRPAAAQAVARQWLRAAGLAAP
jgi:hypothetical protein